MTGSGFTRRWLLCGWSLLGGLACGEPLLPETTSPSAPASAQPVAEKLTLLLQADQTTASARPERSPLPVDARQSERLSMVNEQIAERGIKDQATLDAMRKVPRHLFVENEQVGQAYTDSPLPIGHGQTISQPYIVAFMTEQLRLKPTDRVLEVGAGSGYQAAVLAEIVREVDTIEIIDALARRAADRLKSLNYKNVNVLSGDGYFGRPSRAPYDAIIVTAAASHIPPPLLAQLKPGGRMAIPVGQSGWAQNLLLLEKSIDGSVRTRNLLPVRFVPLMRANP
jgi:protein-L-isoaspartate(D-aspartate) O-methyltransferase